MSVEQRVETKVCERLTCNVEPLSWSYMCMYIPLFRLYQAITCFHRGSDDATCTLYLGVVCNQSCKMLHQKMRYSPILTFNCVSHEIPYLLDQTPRLLDVLISSPEFVWHLLIPVAAREAIRREMID